MHSRRKLGTHAIARLVGVSPSTVLSWIDRGLLEASRTPGGHRRVATRSLAAFLRQHRLSVPPEILEARRLLIIDDEPAFLRAAQRVLQSERLEVDTAVDPLDGMLRVGLTLPDAVLIDVCMPRLDGIELCRRLKSHEETRDIQLITITGAPSPELFSRLREVGVTSCLSKPLDANALLDAIGVRPPLPGETTCLTLS